ncbi:hypothetical protein FQR65_LT01997 [Abscondita terminalis]|nr:hypothetical protein FQR65_LT01997 [Abscondita terminalis]
MMFKVFAFVIIAVSIVAAQRKCCEEGENSVRRKLCKNGSNITGISCDRMYLVLPEPEKNFNIDSEGNLIDSDVKIEPEEYCLTKEEASGNDVALVCLVVPEEESEFFYVFRASCAVISVLFLIITTIVYILVPNLRDLQVQGIKYDDMIITTNKFLQGKCILHSITSLALAMLLLGIMQFGVTLKEGVCEGVGYVTFISFLSTFAWLNTISFHIWRTTVMPTMPGTPKQWYCLYLLYAYGIPLMVVLAAIIAHHTTGNHIKPGIGESFCWFENREAIWAYFYGPILFLLILNLILFCWTVKKLWTDGRNINNSPSKIKSLKYKCLLYIKLFFIMGISWIFEVLSFAFDDKKHFIRYIWMITDFINSIQGVLIFLILVVLRKRAVRGLAKRGLFCIPLPNQWKTLQDEECDDLQEDHENHPEQQLYKQKEARVV